MKRTLAGFIASSAAAGLVLASGCTSMGVSIGLPIPGGGVSVGVGSDGRVSGGVAVGTGGVRVGVGGTAQIPRGEDKRGDNAAPADPAASAPPQR